MNEYEYICNGCGQPKPRDDLFVKKVLFTGMGAGANTLKARVTHWLCERCLVKDEDWNRPPNVQPAERIKKGLING